MAYRYAIGFSRSCLYSKYVHRNSNPGARAAAATPLNGRLWYVLLSTHLRSPHNDHLRKIGLTFPFWDIHFGPHGHLRLARTTHHVTRLVHL